jgi:hypothetical protein
VLLIQIVQNERMTDFSVRRHSLNWNKHLFRGLTLMLVRCSNEQICDLMGYCTEYSGNSLPTFRDSLSVPSSRVKKSKKKAKRVMNSLKHNEHCWNMQLIFRRVVKAVNITGK